MHDITQLEAAGLPGVFVASAEFADAADAQSVALGSDPARVFVEHPIQDRTDAEMVAIAESAVDALLEALTDGRPED